MVSHEQRAAELAHFSTQAAALRARGRHGEAAAWFGRVFDALFLHASRHDCEQAGEAYATALSIKDRIEAQPESEPATDSRWGEVYGHFIVLCHLLGIEENWAYAMTECAKPRPNRRQVMQQEGATAARLFVRALGREAGPEAVERVLPELYWEWAAMGGGEAAVREFFALLLAAKSSRVPPRKPDRTTA